MKSVREDYTPWLILFFEHWDLGELGLLFSTPIILILRQFNPVISHRLHDWWSVF